MLDIGWTELLAIAVLTIIVVGPKDLPKVLRTVGQWTAKARSITREFQNSLDDMVRQTDLDEIKREIDANPYNNIGSLDNIIDPTGTTERVLDLPETSSSSSESDVAEFTAPSPGEDETVMGEVPPLVEIGAAPEEVSSDMPDQPAEDEPQRQIGS
jgi:sec-independent protein translocase protein TatB